MDIGAIFTKHIEVRPCADGSFFVRVGAHDYDRSREPDGVFGFTNIADLMAWLARHAEGLKNQKQCGDDRSASEEVDHMAVVRSSVQR